MSKQKKTAAIKAHWTEQAELGCRVCTAPANLHHAMGGSMRERGIHKGMGQKNNHWLVIPLCHNHHQGVDGIHVIGVMQWEERFGKQADMLDEIAEETGLPIWELAHE